jgi:hypothetical protein
MLSLDQIHAAQANDLTGISAVLEAMSSRIDRLASQAAGRLATNTARYADYADDFRQDAAVSLFEHLPRWTGDTTDSFLAFMYSCIEGDLRAKTHAERNAGIDRDAISVFKSMVERAEGDVFLAEKLAQTVPPAGKRLSADRANAARLAWQGAVSIDKQTDDDDESSILHTLAVVDVTPEVRPKVGRGAVLEALSVLSRYVSVPRDADTREALFKALSEARTGLVDADVIADAVTVPTDPSARRYVLDAVGILYSAASTATDGDLVEELRDVSDDRRDDRAAKHGIVGAVLDAMAPVQADALRYSYGMGDVLCFGTGDAGDLDGMALVMGISWKQAQDARSRGHKSFAKRYIKATAQSEAEAQAMTDIAARNLGRGGRK